MKKLKLILITSLCLQLPGLMFSSEKKALEMLTKTTLNQDTQLKMLQTLYLEQIKRTILNTIYEPASFKEDGSAWPNKAHSMIGKKRMDNLQLCIEDILQNNVPGDLIETGVWRGGATIFMRAILKAYNIKDRLVWAADSFKGVPCPDTHNYPADKDCPLHIADFLRVSLEEVQHNFKLYELLDDQVHFLKGYFKDTMSNNPINKLALMRLDGDMYESTIQVLESLYDKLSIGGYVIIDDYYDKGLAAGKAVNDFRNKRGITDQIFTIDWTGIYWKKSA